MLNNQSQPTMGSTLSTVSVVWEIIKFDCKTACYEMLHVILDFL